MNTDLIKIKKYYGENMMHLCRELFPTLLEIDNLLFTLIESNFAHSRFLYEDIIENDTINEFKNYIYSLIDVEKEEVEVIKTPKELLDEAGYILYECKTEEDIQKFKKYYAKGEELCTFDGGRLNRCHVFFAVKKNADEIKRKKFSNPTRQDEYGTSVISIQFSKGKFNTLSIKNRYNHSVNNPDATFSNNLENIIKGLTKSFEKEHNLNINQNSYIEDETNSFDLPNYVKANDGKFYKYNYEINNIYYCPDNIIIDNFEVRRSFQKKEKYLLIDYFLIDLVNKKISLYDINIEDSFVDGLQNIKKIEINKVNENKIIKITSNKNTYAFIEIDKYNRIIKYENINLKKIKDNFLYRNKSLNYLNIQNVEKIGDNFLNHNKELVNLYLPNVKEVGENFLRNNFFLESIEISNLELAGNNFLKLNRKLKKIRLPNLIKLKRSFLQENKDLEEIDIHNVRKICYNSLFQNQKLKNIYLPYVRKIEACVLGYNNKIEEIDLPNLEELGSSFLEENTVLRTINLPKLTTIKYDCFKNSLDVEKINIPNLKVGKIPPQFQSKIKRKIQKIKKLVKDYEIIYY